MTEPVSSAAPVAALGGLSFASIAMGLDPGAVITAFGGALLFAFMAKDTTPTTRTVGLVSAWIFGYYAAAEIVRRKLLGFDSPQIPAFVSAFFCVALFKLLLSVFNEEGRVWIRKKLGLSPDGGKSD